MQKKLALAGIFSLTLFIICVSIARVVIATSGAQIDLTWVLLWGGIEASVGKSQPSFHVLAHRIPLLLTLSQRLLSPASHPSGHSTQDRNGHPSALLAK